MRKTVVNQEDCMSCGICIASCPDVFRFNSAGKSEAYNSSGALADTIQQVINACPVQCINWETIQEKEMTMQRWVCTICQYVYDPAAGDPDKGVAPGTPFESLPGDWCCPLCGADTGVFEQE